MRLRTSHATHTLLSWPESQQRYNPSIEPSKPTPRPPRTGFEQCRKAVLCKIEEANAEEPPGLANVHEDIRVRYGQDLRQFKRSAARKASRQAPMLRSAGLCRGFSLHKPTCQTRAKRPAGRAHSLVPIGRSSAVGHKLVTKEPVC